jgi:biotin carboxylase
MPNVVFVAPFLLETTLRFIDATADLAGVKVVLVSQDPPERVPAALRKKLALVEKVEDALDPQKIEEAVRSVAGRLGQVDRLLGALEELQVPLGEVRESLRIPGMSGGTAKNFRDKARMKDVLSAAGLPCARHRRVTSEAEVWKFVEEVGYPLIFKPTAGSGSRSTFRVEREAQLEEALGWGRPSAEHASMLEEFITGEEHSFDSVCLGGRVVWCSGTDYHPGPLTVLETPWIQWCVVLPRETDRPDFAAFRPVAQAALAALGMVNGLSHMEWFRRPDGRFAISEVGARPPGAQFVQLISFAHDTDMYAKWARLMVFDEFDPPERPFAAGAAYLRGQGQGRVKAIHGLEEAQRRVGRLAVSVKLPAEGQSASRTYDGDGYVIVRHPETAAVKDALDILIRTIRVELG